VSLHPRNRYGATGHAVHADRATPGTALDQQPTKYRSRCPCLRLPIPAPKTNGLACSTAGGLEQHSPICVYREQKLTASSFQGDLTQADPRLDWRA
jgi:hypothetical protein